MKKIAVLLSTYNGETYIRDQIESILNQKCNIKFDVIVRDDGSKDQTVSILKEYESEKKLRLIEGNNYGAAKSFLWLLKNVNGYDYYAFSDQDDIWYSNKIQEGINIIEKYVGPTLYFSNAYLVDEKNNSLGRVVHKKNPSFTKESILCISTTAQGCTSIINSDLARFVQEKEIPNNIIMHDTYITSLCSLLNGNIVFDSSPYMDYRIHGNNDIGMPTKEQLGIIGMLKLRLKDIFSQRSISMSKQAKTIYDLYGQVFDEDSKNICLLIMNAEHSFFSRLKLSVSKNLKYESLSMCITYRIKILLGNN